MTYPDATAFAYANSESISEGLTKREYFAAMALQAIVSNSKLTKLRLSIEEEAGDAVQYADALIEALNKEQ